MSTTESKLVEVQRLLRRAKELLNHVAADAPSVVCEELVGATPALADLSVQIAGAIRTAKEVCA